MEHLVVAEHLGRRYGKHWAVNDLTLHIKPGEVFGVLGPNGAGKTTTMRMLACLVSPSTGSATVCGYDVVRDASQVRKCVGILTESAGLYDALSAQENLEFFAKLYDLSPREVKSRAEHYLKLLGLWERRRDPVGTFSSGMKQKLSMARALIHEPSVLLLDEPTATLDPEGAKLVRDFIHSLKGLGCSIVLCTHNLNEAQSLCDRVAIVKRTLLRVGTPLQLQTSLYGRQVEFRVAVGVGRLEGLNVGMSESSSSAETFQPSNLPTFQLSNSDTESINDLAVTIANMPGIGDVAVSGSSLFVSMEDPDRYTALIVRYLVAQGMDVTRVAEVEHSLERAYLDLVSRVDDLSADEQAPNRGQQPKVEVAA